MDVEEIRCFQHCERDQNILCFSIPHQCPVCGHDTRTTQLRIPPYVIQSPFTDAQCTQCSIVIKPTVGHFLHEFTDKSNLHIGLTDSQGTVYEYDERGVTVGDTTWNYCLRVILHSVDGVTSPDWDRILKHCVNERLWKQEYYDESLHNCFDFVLFCLRKMGLDRDIPCLIDRSLFCQQLIIPETIKAGKYISLYREIVKNGLVVQKV
ncbi:MKRN2 opposite strand [Mactra antiquata]